MRDKSLRLRDPNRDAATKKQRQQEQSKQVTLSTGPALGTKAAMNVRDAATVGDLASVRRLVEGGADVDCANAYGHTALINAAHNGHGKIVEYLLERGAAVNAVDISKEDALMSAAKRGDLEVCRMLVKAGADISARDMRGAKAKHKAQAAGHTAVVEYLRKEKRKAKGRKYKGYVTGGRTKADRIRDKAERSASRHQLKNFSKRSSGGQSLQQALSVGSSELGGGIDVRPRSFLPPSSSSDDDDADSSGSTRAVRQTRPPVPRAALEASRPRVAMAQPTAQDPAEELPPYAEFFGLKKKEDEAPPPPPPRYSAPQAGSSRSRPGVLNRQQSKDAWV